MPRHIDAQELDFSGLVMPGDFVVWGQACGEPVVLTTKLMEQRQRIGSFGAFIGISLSDTPNPEYADCVRFTSFCASANNARLAGAGKLDILPVHYSRLVKELKDRVDILLLQLAEHPDGGRYSLSSSCDYVHDLVADARVVIAEVNRQAPFTDASIEAGDIDVLMQTDYPPLSLSRQPPSSVIGRIAAHVAAMIGDGATLQFGLGATPEGVASVLADRKHLGLHTGVMSDAQMALIQAGAVDNSLKPFDRGVSVAGGLLGSPSLLAFADRNPAISLRPIGYTHDLRRIASMPGFTAVNSAIEVDLSGQANTESLGDRYLGAIGGAVDFSRAAHASAGGLPIVALTATARGKDGTVTSRIVSGLSGPATIGRADIGVIVTEHGAADLRGLSLSERARRLVAIADPRFQDDLAAAAASLQ